MQGSLSNFKLNFPLFPRFPNYVTDITYIGIGGIGSKQERNCTCIVFQGNLNAQNAGFYQSLKY